MTDHFTTYDDVVARSGRLDVHPTPQHASTDRGFPHVCAGTKCAVCRWIVRTKEQRDLTRSEMAVNIAPPQHAPLDGNALLLIIESSQRVERNRIYAGLKKLYQSTEKTTGHGRAQRIAYRRALDIILTPKTDGIDTEAGDKLGGTVGAEGAQTPAAPDPPNTLA